MSFCVAQRLLLFVALGLAAACGGSSSQARCGAGTLDRGGVCVPIDGGPQPTCGAGTVLVAGQCVPVDAGPGVACGPGTELDGGQCVPVDGGPGVACGPGTELDGGQCLPVDGGPGMTCGPGTVLDGGACIGVADAGPTSCGPGTVLYGGTCVASTCDPAMCNSAHAFGDPTCRGPVCNCAAPYYDAHCDSAAVALSSATVVGAVGSRSDVYYSFVAPSGASSIFLNIYESTTVGQLDVYVEQTLMPFYTPPGTPDYSVSLSQIGEQSAKHLLVLPLPTPATDPYYLLLRNSGATDNLRYNITVIPY